MIHQYKNNGYNIVLDVNSGSVHVMEDVAYDAVALIEASGAGAAYDHDAITKELGKTYAYADIQEALEEIDVLAKEELLFAEDIYRDFVMDFKKRKMVVKALCLNVSHDCNLGCKYCFAGEGAYHGSRGLMSFEVGKKALDFLVKNSGHRINLEVDFFGGEPLMNWEVVKQIVEYGRSLEVPHHKKFRFTLTTNGVLVDEDVMEFCDREMANVVMSLDGRKEVNDNMRPTRNGKSSYDIIVPKFQEFAKRRGDKSYFIRGTFTHFNTDFANDVIHYADLGFDKLSMEPVVAQPEDAYAITEEDLPKILEEYDRLAVEYIKRRKEGKGFNFFHFNIDLDHGPCVAKCLAGCGAGTEYLGVTPWGDLYPCHQFVGMEDFCLGNLDDGIVNTELRDEFKLCNVYAKEKCKNCFARFYCSGGCAANSYNFHHSLTDAYDIGCVMQKKRIECAIMIKAALAEMDENEETTGEDIPELRR